MPSERPMTTAQHQDPDERTCPGLHSLTRPAPALRPEEHLCRFCLGRAMHHLEELAEDLRELEVTAVRQSRVRVTGTASRARDEKPPAQIGDEVVGTHEQRLPFDVQASDVRTDVVQRLTEWADHVAAATGMQLKRPERRPWTIDVPKPTPVRVQRCVHDMVLGTCAVCRGLPDIDEELLQVVHGPRPPADPIVRPRPARVAVALAVLRDRRARNWMRTDEQGPQCAEAIAYVRRTVRAKIDRYDRRWYAGECGQPTTVIDLDEVDGVLIPRSRTTQCTADLYAEPGKAVVVCDGYREPHGVGGCGAMHPAVTRHRYVVQALRARWLPLDAILSVMPMIVGRAPEPGTVRLWRHRGRLRPLVCLIKHDDQAEQAACRLCRGEMYVGGQVLDLVLDEKPRPGPKRRERRRVSA